MTELDREALNAAADRGLLAAYWAERQPDKVAIAPRPATARSPRSTPNANRLVRALRARGVQAGRRLALLCANRPEFAETVVAVRQAGLRLTTINWHLTADEAGYIVDDCDATAFVADARFADAAAGAAEARTAAARLARDRRRRSTASRRGTTRSRPSTAARRSTIRAPAARCSTRRARPAARRVCARRAAIRAADLDVGAARRSTTPTAHVHLAPARCTTRRRSRSRGRRPPRSACRS